MSIALRERTPGNKSLRSAGALPVERSKAYVYVAPAAVLFAVFMLWPMIRTVQLSFTSWNGLTESAAWVGLDNYRQLFGDGRFAAGLANNVRWVVGSWLAQGLGLALAAVLSASWIRGRTFFRAAFFLPATLSLVVVGIIWEQIYQPNTGLLNEALGLLGAQQLTHPWLADGSTAMWTVIATANWTYFGFAMVIFLGGIQAIDQELYESAALDGAGPLGQFRYVTIPGLRHHISLVLVISFINTLRTFDLVYVMTNGGPGRRTEVIAYYIYSLAFVTRQVGYGAAAAVTLTVVILAVTVIFLRLRDRE